MTLEDWGENFGFALDESEEEEHERPAKDSDREILASNHNNAATGHDNSDAELTDAQRVAEKYEKEAQLAAKGLILAEERKTAMLATYRLATQAGEATQDDLEATMKAVLHVDHAERHANTAARQALKAKRSATHLDRPEATKGVLSPPATANLTPKKLKKNTGEAGTPSRQQAQPPSMPSAKPPAFGSIPPGIYKLPPALAAAVTQKRLSVADDDWDDDDGHDDTPLPIRLPRRERQTTRENSAFESLSATIEDSSEEESFSEENNDADATDFDDLPPTPKVTIDIDDLDLDEENSASTTQAANLGRETETEAESHNATRAHVPSVTRGTTGRRQPVVMTSHDEDEDSGDWSSDESDGDETEHQWMVGRDVDEDSDDDDIPTVPDGRFPKIPKAIKIPNEIRSMYLNTNDKEMRTTLQGAYKMCKADFDTNWDEGSTILMRRLDEQGVDEDEKATAITAREIDRRILIGDKSPSEDECLRVTKIYLFPQLKLPPRIIKRIAVERALPALINYGQSPGPGVKYHLLTVDKLSSLVLKLFTDNRDLTNPARFSKPLLAPAPKMACGKLKRDLPKGGEFSRAVTRIVNAGGQVPPNPESFVQEEWRKKGAKAYMRLGKDWLGISFRWTDVKGKRISMRDWSPYVDFYDRLHRLIMLCDAQIARQTANYNHKLVLDCAHNLIWKGYREDEGRPLSEEEEKKVRNCSNWRRMGMVQPVYKMKLNFIMGRGFAESSRKLKPSKKTALALKRFAANTRAKPMGDMLCNASKYWQT